MRLTRAGVALSSTGLALLGLGMATANLELLLLAALPLLLLAHPLASVGAGRALGARTLSTRTPRRADIVETRLRLDLPRAPELVEVHAPLPPSWRLEDGSNLHVFAKGGARDVRFRARALGRGRHVLPPVTAERVDPTGVVAPRATDLTGEESVEVTSRASSAKPVRGRMKGALDLPEHETLRLGMGTSDFRELRDYHWGDPPKAINWKATARRLSGRARQGADAPRVPLVNEFENEDRRTILVLLDGGTALRVGTTLETGVDHGVEAALAAARFFLARGSRVGAATYGARASHVAAPDAGSGQAYSIERALAAGEPDPDETAVRAMERFHRHLAGSRPLVVVVTRLTPDSKEPVLELARRMRGRMGAREKRLPLLVLDVDALALLPQDDPAVETAALLVAREDAEARREVQAAGARVVAWRLETRDFRSALLGRRAA